MPKAHRTIPQLTKQEIDRFWGYVDKTLGHGPRGDCWIWIAGRNGNNYGAFCVRWFTYIATRIAYFIAVGVDPAELNVLHHCDNPPCVNPSHLFLGTLRDNTLDMVQKNRQARGAKSRPKTIRYGMANNKAKLRDEERFEIMRLVATGATSKTAIAKRFGVDFNVVQQIIKSPYWTRKAQELYPDEH